MENSQAAEEEAREVTAATEAAQSQPDAVLEDLQVRRALSGQGMLFHPSPQALVGIQLWGIGRQTIHPSAGVVFRERRPRLFRALGV